MKFRKYLFAFVLAFAVRLCVPAMAQNTGYYNQSPSSAYQQGYQDGRHDRDNHRGGHPNAQNWNGQDRQAYESGYWAGFGKPHVENSGGDPFRGGYKAAYSPNGNGNYAGRLNAHDQGVYDQLYNNFLQAQSINDQAQVRKAESAMQNVYRQYGIPSNTPYAEVASSGYRNGYGHGPGNNGYGHYGSENYSGRLNAHDQNVYNQLYANWLQARSINAQAQVQKAETAMQTVMRKYGIPPNTPYGAIATQR